MRTVTEDFVFELMNFSLYLQMNPFFLNSVIKTILERRRKKRGQPASYTQEEVSKEYNEIAVSVKRGISDFVLISLGITSASLGIKGFLVPNNLIDGGITGISLLITIQTGIHVGLVIFVMNIPFIIMGGRIVTKIFSLKTAASIIGFSIILAIIPFPLVTSDRILAAIFGGFFLGIGTGLAVRGGAVIDGTEILAVFISRKLSMTIGDIILVINVFIFSSAAYLLSIDTALYSIVTYIAASKTVDFVIEGIEEYTAVTIVSPYCNEIRETIIAKLGHGVTILKGKGGFGKRGVSPRDIDILVTVVTRLEVSKLTTEIEKIDPEAFVAMDSIKDTRGGMIKKRRLAT